MVFLPILLVPFVVCSLVSANGSPYSAVFDRGLTLSLSRRINATSMRYIVEQDRARAKALRSRGTFLESKVATSPEPSSSDENQAEPASQEIFNAGLLYYATVGIGNPPTEYHLIVDTGSANTWNGADRPYMPTNTSSVHYGSGAFFGLEYRDLVTVVPGVSVNSQSIGGAYHSTGIKGYDGILGLGPLYLTRGALYPAFNSIVPTVTTNLFRQAKIPNDVVSAGFKPFTSGLESNITFGGVDRTQFVGSINYTPKTRKAPARQYWGIDQSIRYGASNNILLNSPGIVDTGTTLIMIASDAFERYKSATGAVLDGETGLLRITPFQYLRLQSLYFTMSNITYQFTPNAQIWPRALNYAIGGSTSNIYLVVADIGEVSGSGLDFITGYAFLERYYAVFNSTNGSVGFARNPAAFGIYT